MQEIFNINNVDIIVDYNEIIYSHNDVLKLLKYGAKSLDNLFEITSEIEIVNLQEVEKKLFIDNVNKTDLKTFTADLTSYLDSIERISKMFGTPCVLENYLQGFGLTGKQVEGNTYELSGKLKDLKKFVNLFCSDEDKKTFKQMYK